MPDSGRPVLNSLGIASARSLAGGRGPTAEIVRFSGSA